MPDQTMTMTETWVPVTGGEIRVRRHAPDDRAGRPVLFVHGAFVNGHLWDGVIAALGASGEPLDLIAPDLPLGAHHRPMADRTDLTMPAMTEMLIAVLDALELDEVVVAANDSGGAITQHLIVNHPTRFSGALFTSTETVDNFPPSFFRFLFPPLRLRSLMWSTCQLLRTNGGRRLPFTFGHLIKRRMTTTETRDLMGPLWTSPGARDDLRRFLIGIDRRVMEETAARFDRFPAPVDVAWTANDRVFPDGDATYLAEAFPLGRRVADITEAGSLSPYDQPQQVADRVRGLLDRSSS